MKQRALEKIAKCLELGNSSNVNEAAQAIRMAQRLMLKYGLEQSDIELIQMGKTSSQTLLAASPADSVIKIIQGINHKFGVEAVLVAHKGLKRVEFVGHAERAVFAAFAFDIVYREMNSAVGMFRNSFEGSGTDKVTVSRRVTSYAAGWLEGALEKLPTLREGERNDKMDDYLDEMFENLDRESFKAAIKASMANLTDDFETGMKKGRRINVNRPVEGAKAPERLN